MGSTWAFDVDGTLIGSIRSDQLRPGAHELLRELTARGASCVLWSAGGEEYAARKAREHGFADHVTAYYAKSARDAHGRYLIEHFELMHRPDVFVDDVPIDMPLGATVIAVSQFFGGNHADRGLLAVLDALDQHVDAIGEAPTASA